MMVAHPYFPFLSHFLRFEDECIGKSRNHTQYAKNTIESSSICSNRARDIVSDSFMTEPNNGTDVGNPEQILQPELAHNII